MLYRANQDAVHTDTGSLSLPALDFYLDVEINKAATMLYNFKNTLGEEKIPKELLDIAKGVVFFTIVKAGFMFTGRYGTGLVVAKLPDGRWSAPSAVMITGFGWGLQIGAELTDVMLILSSDQAVNTFKSRTQVSVGAELGVSVGPIGRSIESDVTAGSKGAAHAFAYAQSKGLFFGASLEASGIAARPDVNRAFYGEKLTISNLLSGDYPPPKGAEPLYKAINEVLFDNPPTPQANGRPSMVAPPPPPPPIQSQPTNFQERPIEPPRTGYPVNNGYPSNPGYSQSNGYSGNAAGSNNFPKGSGLENANLDL